MRVLLVTPAPPRSHSGNRVTARRWAAILRELGHAVDVREPAEVRSADDTAGFDLVVALHARRSADAVRAARSRGPEVPVALALTGTDLYPDLARTGVDPEVLAAATVLLVLQPLAAEQVPAHLRDRVRVIRQSAVAEPVPGAVPGAGAATTAGAWDVAMLGHVRAVKDPLVVAAAVRLLPGGSRIRVRHAGAVLEPELGERVAEENRTNPRYEWVGELSHAEAIGLLARSRLLVHPSRHEGGANVCSEALAVGTPVVASRIPGTEGILGRDYPGYFPVGDAAALADLLARVERDAGGLYGELRRRFGELRELADPARERAAWADLLAELVR